MANLDELRRLAPGAPVRVGFQSGTFGGLSTDGRIAFVKFPRRVRGKVKETIAPCAPEAVEVLREKGDEKDRLDDTAGSGDGSGEPRREDPRAASGGEVPDA